MSALLTVDEINNKVQARGKEFIKDFSCQLQQVIGDFPNQSHTFLYNVAWRRMCGTTEQVNHIVNMFKSEHVADSIK